MKKDEVKIIQEEPASWLATFGDLATLLFTFYCLIYASCTYRPGQWETTRSALEKVLSVLPGTTSSTLVGASGDGALPGKTAIVATLHSGVGTTQRTREEIEATRQEIQEMTQALAPGEHVDLEATAEGFVLRLSGALMFESGQRELLENSKPILASVARMIDLGPGEVSVEGHTDDVPIRSGRYRSNWHLSAARAAEVVRFLEQHTEYTQHSHFAAKAFGSYAPLVRNSDAKARAQNRRVEIRMKYAQVSHTPAAASEGG